MLKTLIKKQLKENFLVMFGQGMSDKSKRKKKTSIKEPKGTGKKLLFAAIWIYAVIALGAMFYMMADFLCVPFVTMGYGWLYFAIMGLVSVVVGVVGSVFTTYSSLYFAKDNELLLSMPISPSKILVSRLISIYIMGLIYEVLVLGPTFVVYAMEYGLGVTLVVSWIILLLLINLFVLSLSCVLAGVVGIISINLTGKFKNAVIMVLSLGFIAAYYYLYSKVFSYFTNILSSNQAEIGNAIKKYVYPVYKLGEAAEGNLKSLAIFALIVVAIFVVIYLLLAKSFIRIMTTKKGEKKAKYVKHNLINSGIDAALLKKERLRFTGSTTYMMNCGLGTVFLVVAGIALIYKASDMKILFGGLGGAFGDGVMSLLAIAAVCTMTSMNDISAPSVSLEGNTLWILKSLPIDPIKPLMAKLKLHLYITMVPTVFLDICSIVVLKLDIYYSVILILASMAFVLFNALVGLAANLRFPNLEWTNEITPIKQGASVIIAMLGGMAFVITLGVVYYLVADYVSARVFATLAVVFVAALDYIIYRWIMKKGAEIFANL